MVAVRGSERFPLDDIDCVSAGPLEVTGEFVVEVTTTDGAVVTSAPVVVASDGCHPILEDVTVTVKQT